jgi:hypothetical protein
VAGKESSPTAVLGCGCVVLGLGLALFMAGIFAYTSVVAEHTWLPPGDPAHFDPVAGFGRIQTHAGAGARLLGFEARFVRADGTWTGRELRTPRPPWSTGSCASSPAPEGRAAGRSGAGGR